MALDSLHPQYAKFYPDWIKMRDLYNGERSVKEKGTTYLPPTQGMILDGMKFNEKGLKAYESYVLRAVFPELVKEAVEAAIGGLHSKPAKITLPAKLEVLRENATVSGESLEQLLRRINEEQLVSGRCGLLLDLPTNPDPANPLPYIAFYIAESIRNWDDGDSQEGKTKLNLVILDESGYVREKDFQWKAQTKYRVLQLGNVDENEIAGTYLQGVFVTDGGTPTYVEALMQSPQLRGSTLQEIPFVFVNSKDIVASPDNPPLLGLGNEALTIYRGEADYRQHLFMTGQDTLVVIGGVRVTDATEQDAELRTGAGAYLEIEADGDAKYIGVNSQGLPEQRVALENDRQRAERKAGQLLPQTGDAESGEALKTRVAAQTASLNQIANTSAKALEQILKIAAVWVGANPDEVIVSPNLEFGRASITGKEVLDLITARTMGAPISMKSIHDVMVSRNLTKMVFEDEMELIEEENANMPAPNSENTNNEGE